MGVPKFSRWVSLISGMLMMLVSGTIYLYPGYSGNLKTLMGYDVEQTDFIGTMLNAGTWVGVLGGLFYDKFGPRLTSIGASALVFLGYFAMYLSTNMKLTTNSVAVGIFAFVVGQGSGWLYTAALNTNVGNFTKQDRGKVMGLLTCCFGLCSGVFTLIMKTFYFTEVSQFMLFLALCIPAVAFVNGTVFLNFLTEYPKNYGKQIKIVYFGYAIMLTVAVWISISSIVTNFTPVKPFYFCIAMFGLIALLLTLPFFSSEKLVLAPPVANDQENLLEENNNAANPKSLFGEDLNLWQFIKTVECWLLFYTHFAIIGAGITLLNNINEIVISMEYPAHPGEEFPTTASLPHIKYATTFVIMFSVCNTLGRLTVGFVSDRFLHKFPRTFWLSIVAAIMAIAQVYYFLSSIPALFGGVFLHGIAYGGAFALVPTLTVEIFGLKYFGATFGWIGIAPALGSELIATLVAGKLNDHFRQEHYILVGGVKHCFGSVCFRYTLMITFGLCITAIISALLLKYRVNKLLNTPSKNINNNRDGYSVIKN